jgi:hypothetical protein
LPNFCEKIGVFLDINSSLQYIEKRHFFTEKHHNIGPWRGGSSKLSKNSESLRPNRPICCKFLRCICYCASDVIFHCWRTHGLDFRGKKVAFQVLLRPVLKTTELRRSSKPDLS